MTSLVELDSVEILVIVDNELDPISSCPTDAVTQVGGLKDVAMAAPNLEPGTRGNAVKELRMDSICCGAHGLSLLITGVRDDQRHTILFDTGPEERAFELNARRLKANLGDVEAIQLSHWHRDHSGGMLKALPMAQAAGAGPITVDLHPARPDFRGFMAMAPVSLEADPTFEEIERAGGKVAKNDQDHTLLDDFFLVSGEIPRVTAYELGIRRGLRYSIKSGEWTSDELITDERFLMCKLKGLHAFSVHQNASDADKQRTGKGIVMFTGCSHAGVVNASRHAVSLEPGVPLYAVMGGYHLADAEPQTISDTVEDLKSLEPKMLMTGHCTGWRAKFKIQEQMPGRLLPSFVGSKFVL